MHSYRVLTVCVCMLCMHEHVFACVGTFGGCICACTGLGIRACVNARLCARTCVCVCVCVCVCACEQGSTPHACTLSFVRDHAKPQRFSAFLMHNLMCAHVYGKFTLLKLEQSDGTKHVT